MGHDLCLAFPFSFGQKTAKRGYEKDPPTMPKPMLTPMSKPCAFAAPRSSARRLLRFAHGGLGFAALLGGLILSACTREATEADCELIVSRNVELQMKAMNTTDPAAIAKVQQEIRQDQQMKDDLRSKCLGRKVTDGMINCVRNAKTSDEISQCLR